MAIVKTCTPSRSTATNLVLMLMLVSCLSVSQSAPAFPFYQRFPEYDSPGNDLSTITVCTTEDCCSKQCTNQYKCSGYVWTYNITRSSPWYHRCFLKQGSISPKPLPGGSTWTTEGLVVAIKGQQQPVYKRYYEYDSYGNDLSTSTSCSTETCCARLCNSTTGCVAYVWAYKLPSESNWYHYCWLKAAANPQPLSSGQSWATTGLMVGVRGSPKHGNTGAVSCASYCGSAECVSAFDTAKREKQGCAAVRGSALPEVTCNCYTRGVVDCDFLFSGCSSCGADAVTRNWACTSCKAGTRMNSFKTACVTCPVGRHSKGGTQQTCKLCQEGYSTSKSGSAACDICLPGFGRQSTGGSFTCTACEPGYFSTGLGACNSCSAGFTSGPKAASCPNCTPGAAYVFCGTCLQGMYSTGGNSGGLAADTECKLCPGGTTAGPGAFTLANCSGTARPGDVMVALLSHSLNTLESLHSKFPDLTANPLIKVVLEMYGRRLGMIHTLLLMHAGTSPKMAIADAVSKQTGAPDPRLHRRAQGPATTAESDSGIETWEWVKEKATSVKDVVISGLASFADDIFSQGIPLLSGLFTAADAIDAAGTTGDGRPVFGVGLEDIMHDAKFGDDAMSKKLLRDSGMSQAEIDAMFGCHTTPSKPRRQLRALPATAGPSQLGPVCGNHGTCNTDNGTCKCVLGWSAVPDCTYKEGGGMSGVKYAWVALPSSGCSFYDTISCFADQCASLGSGWRPFRVGDNLEFDEIACAVPATEDTGVSWAPNLNTFITGGALVAGEDTIVCTAKTWAQGAGQMYQADAAGGAILLCSTCSPDVNCESDFVSAAAGGTCHIGVRPPSSIPGLPSTFQGTLCRVPSFSGAALWNAGQAPTGSASGGCVTSTTIYGPEPDFQMWCPPDGSFA